MTDDTLTFYVNLLGCLIFVLIFGYHYVTLAERQ